MKNPNFLKFGIASFVIAMMAFGLQSFTGEKTESASTTYFYIGSDMQEGAFADPGNWSLTGEGECAEGDDVPCELIVPDNKTLVEHIGNKSNSIVLSLASTIRDAS